MKFREKDLDILEKKLNVITNKIKPLKEIEVNIINSITEVIKSMPGECNLLTLEEMLKENNKNHILIKNKENNKYVYISGTLNFWNALQASFHEKNYLSIENKNDKKIGNFSLNKNYLIKLSKILEEISNENSFESNKKTNSISYIYTLKYILKLIKTSKYKHDLLPIISEIIEDCFKKNILFNKKVNYIEIVEKLGDEIMDYITMNYIKEFFNKEKSDMELLDEIYIDLKNIKSIIFEFETLDNIEKIKKFFYKVGINNLFNFDITFESDIPYKEIKSYNQIYLGMMLSFYNMINECIKRQIIIFNSTYKERMSITEEEKKDELNKQKQIKKKFKEYIFTEDFKKDSSRLRKEFSANLGAIVFRKLFEQNLINVSTEYHNYDDDIVNQEEKKNKKTPFTVSFDTNNFFLHGKAKMPCLYNDIDKITLVKENGFNIFNYKRKLIHQKYYIEGKTKNENFIKHIESYNKYCLNFKAINLNLEILTKVLDNSDNLVYLSEIYNINFVNLRKNIYKINDKDIKNKVICIFNKILEYSCNFEDNEKFSFEFIKKIINEKNDREDILEKENKVKNIEFYKTLKKIINNIYSKKFELLFKLEQIIIHKMFKYFNYQMFLDSRGRLYAEGFGITPQSYSGTFNLLSFYKAKNLQELYPNKNDYSNVTKEITNNLIESIKVLYKKNESFGLEEIISSIHFNDVNNELNYYHNSEIINNCLIKILEKNKIKLGEFTRFSSLMTDLIYFTKNPIKHRFNSFFCLDSSSSGIQICSMLLRSKKLAKYCSLITNSVDIYLNYCEYLEQKSNKIISMVANWPIEIKNILDNIIVYYNHDKQLGMGIQKIENIKFKYGDLFACKDFLFKYDIDNKKIMDLKEYFINNNLNKLEDWQMKMVLIYNVYQFAKDFEKIPWINELFKNRKCHKSQILAYPYGGTASGRWQQYLDYMLDTILLEGKLYTENDFKIYKKLIIPVEKMLNNWLINEIPESLNFVKLGEYLTNNNKEIELDHDYFKFIMYPRILETIRYRIGVTKDKDGQYVKVSANVLSKEKNSRVLKQSFSANFVQSCDAMIAMLILEKMIIHYGFKTNSNHDSFRTEFLGSIYLKNVCFDSYKTFLNKDLLKKYWGEKFLKENFTEEEARKLNKLLFNNFDNLELKLNDIDLNFIGNFVKL